jgi:hypothetical protein
MDETPEEMEQIRREAAAIDPYRYRRRSRYIKAVVLGAALAGLTWVVLELTDRARNPCERLRDHYCDAGPGASMSPLQCSSYTGIFQESVEDSSQKMRSLIREQCVTKIRRLKEEEGIEVR